MKSAADIANEILALYTEKGAANYSGEKITQLEHASQAAQQAKEDGQNGDVILAAFLHDIGHLADDSTTGQMEGYGTQYHEAVGAAKLKAYGFSENITTLVQSHVAAKRYLCYANKRYFDNLSHASKMTLQFQGGPMTATEAAAFEANPLKTLIIKMRTWDEEAKHEHVPLMDMDYLRRLITEHLNSRSEDFIKLI
jgi:phosphonate degradation associated HDIG domain protein